MAAVKRAADLSSRLTDAEQRDAGLFGAATLYLRLSEVEAATALHDQIHAGWLSPHWLYQLSYTQMKAGKFVEAERLAEKIAESDPGWEMPYVSLAAGLADAGQFDEARRVARRRPTPTWQVSSLVTVARASAPIDPDLSAECLAEAEVLAAGIADAEGRLTTLGWVGAAFAETGASDRAQALAERLVGEGAGPDITSSALRDTASAPERCGQDGSGLAPV